MEVGSSAPALHRREFNWTNVLFIAAAHVLALTASFKVHGFREPFLVCLVLLQQPRSFLLRDGTGFGQVRLEGPAFFLLGSALGLLLLGGGGSNAGFHNAGLLLVLGAKSTDKAFGFP